MGNSPSTQLFFVNLNVKDQQIENSILMHFLARLQKKTSGYKEVRP